eukprot:2376054-Amphidinium_carterae.1
MGDSHHQSEALQPLRFLSNAGSPGGVGCAMQPICTCWAPNSAGTSIDYNILPVLVPYLCSVSPEL